MFFLSTDVLANDMTYEQKLNACAACHGVNGDKPVVPSYPILAVSTRITWLVPSKAYKSKKNTPNNECTSETPGSNRLRYQAVE